MRTIREILEDKRKAMKKYSTLTEEDLSFSEGKEKEMIETVVPSLENNEGTAQYYYNT